jgi:hypothetical protein
MMKLKDLTPKADQKVYSQDLNKKGAKTFFCKTLPEMWELMRNKTPLNYCEVIGDSPCHLYFDLDEGNVRAVWRKLEEMLNKVFSTLKSQVGIVKYYFLDASKTYPDGTRKNSAHIICAGEKYILQSPTQGRAFVQRLSDIFEDEFDIEIDNKIYTRNRCFRMLGNSKYGQQRPLRGPSWTMENWVATLVQPVKTLDVAELGLGNVVSAPLRNNSIPPCVGEVLEWANASDYQWKNSLEWVWGGHLRKGVCKLAKREHRRNNRWFRYEATKGVIIIGCHHCRRTYNELVPSELQSNVRKFLNQLIKT